MDLRAASSVVRRHRAVVSVGLLIAVVVALYAGHRVKPDYQAKATWIFLSPSLTTGADGKPQEVNPFSSLGNAERVAANAVYTVTQSDGWTIRMRAKGATGSYEYKPLSDVIIQLTVTDSSARSAMHTLSVGVDLVKQELAKRQEAAGAPNGTLIAVDILSMSDSALELTSSQKRVMGAVGAIGVVVAVSLAFLLEADPVSRSLQRARARLAALLFVALLPRARRLMGLSRVGSEHDDAEPPDHAMAGSASRATDLRWEVAAHSRAHAGVRTGWSAEPSPAGEADGRR